MKKITFLAAIALSVLTVQKSEAQISLNVNIGSQPAWGPVGYDHVDYYYLPDIDAYYDVPAQQYVVYENNTWVHRAALPSRYNSFNPYNSYKVVVNEPTPWVHNTVIREKYVVYKGKPSAPVIRDSRDVKYVKYRGKHTTVTKVNVHNNYNDNSHNVTRVKVKGNNGHGNGHGHGHGKH